MKVVVGADFIITLLVAERNHFPPLPARAMLDYQPRNGRRTSARVARRVRPERHSPQSIASLRLLLAHHLPR